MLVIGQKSLDIVPHMFVSLCLPGIHSQVRFLLIYKYIFPLFFATAAYPERKWNTKGRYNHYIMMHEHSCAENRRKKPPGNFSYISLQVT